MKFEICFEAPLVVEIDDLNDVLVLAHKAGVVFELRPVVQTIDYAAPLPVEQATKPARKKPGRKPKAKSEPKPDPVPEQPLETPVSRDQVLVLFSTLVESDFDRAAALLEEFGISRFSELPEIRLVEFAARL